MLTNFYSFIQIILESFPVSSSGHGEILTRILHLPSLAFHDTLNFLLHGPTSLVIALYFRDRWIFLIKHIFRLWRFLLRLCMVGLCAEVPTVIMYALIKKYNLTIPLWMGLSVTAFFLVSLRFITTKNTPLTLCKAFLIGCAQGVALLPGISRLGSTMVVAQHLGISPRTSFVFSCTIQWPLITAAFLYGMYESSKFGMQVPQGFIIGVVLASVIAYLGLSLVERMAIQKTLWRFGVYMIIPAMIAFLM